MKLSELFIIAADNHLWDGAPDNNWDTYKQSQFICCSLGYAEESLGNNYFSNLSMQGRQLVQNHMKTHTCLEDWLIAHKHIKSANKRNYPKIQAYRKAWMYHLANELNLAGT